MTEWAAILNLSLLMGALVAVTSGIIHGYTGFGAALFMTPLFAILFGPVEAIGVGSVIGFCGSAQLYPGAARNAVWRELIPIFAGIVILTPFGAILLFKTDPELIRRAMGVLILLFALILISGWVYRGPRGPVSSAAVGALAVGSLALPVSGDRRLHCISCLLRHHQKFSGAIPLLLSRC